MKKTLFIIILLLGYMFSFAQETASENLLHLNDDSFDEAAKNQLIIVDFYTDWCPPCRKFAPIFEAVAKELPDFTFAKVNVDKSIELSNRYDIQFIPYIVAVKNGKVVDKYNPNFTQPHFSKWVKKQKK